MRVLVSWLREFVDVPVGGEELARMFGLRGFEVAAVEPPPPGAPHSSGDDQVIDVEITANRPDCLSVVGMAREASAIYDRPLRLPVPDPDAAAPAGTSGGDDRLRVTLEDAELCPRYAAAVAEVRIGPSPAWLAARLHAAGVRPINNIVDVTNYVMVELGHPMHAFDLERLGGGELRIRRARPGERIRTLDGVDRALTDAMLVIADADRPQAVAGVMGGADSEVSSKTRLIALESACFQPASVRRTSKRLGLLTDASYRFERGADVSAPVVAILRAQALLEQIGAGRGASIVDRYPAPRVPARLALRHDRIRLVLGQAVDEAFVENVLERLGFRVARRSGHDGHAWDVTVPTRRVDVTREVDLIEEVGRYYGFDRLPATFPPLTAPPAPPEPRLERDRLVRRVLAAAGFSEAVTFCFVEAAAAAAFADPPDATVAIANPLSEKFAVMRPSLLPGLVEAVAYNRRRERRDVRLFEIGNVFSPAGERRRAAFAWIGAAAPIHWSARPRDVDFFDVKGTAEHLCRGVGVEPALEPAIRPYLVPGRAAAIRPAGRPPDAGTAPLGVLGVLQPKLAAALGLASSDEVYVAELDLDASAAAATSREDFRIEPLPRHPSIVRDLSIVVVDALPATAVRGTIRAAAPPTLESVREFDRYQGAGVAPGRVSLSVRLTFRAPDRTLTDGEVQKAMDRIVAALAEAHGATLR